MRLQEPCDLSGVSLGFEPDCALNHWVVISPPALSLWDCLQAAWGRTWEYILVTPLSSKVVTLESRNGQWLILLEMPLEGRKLRFSFLCPAYFLRAVSGSSCSLSWFPCAQKRDAALPWGHQWVVETRAWELFGLWVLWDLGVAGAGERGRGAF